MNSSLQPSRRSPGWGPRCSYTIIDITVFLPILLIERVSNFEWGDAKSVTF